MLIGLAYPLLLAGCCCWCARGLECAKGGCCCWDSVSCCWGVVYTTCWFCSVADGDPGLLVDNQSSGRELLLPVAMAAKRPVAAVTGPVTDEGVVDVPARCSGVSALTNVKDAAPATTLAIVPTAVTPVVEPPFVVSMLESLVSMLDAAGSAPANLEVAANTTPPVPTTPVASS